METGKKLKVLFSDLDGTLIETLSGKEFPIGCFDMQPKIEVLKAIKLFKPDVVVIVSNQGGIQEGYVNGLFFRNKIKWVTSIVAECCGCECVFDYCPSSDPTNVMRKPNIGMIDRYRSFVLSKHYDAEYFMIGDRNEDEQCAKNAKINYLDVNEFVKEYNKD